MKNRAEEIRLFKSGKEIIAELLCDRRLRSGAPWVRKFGNLSMREILILTSAYVRLPVQTLGEGEGSSKATRRREENAIFSWR